MSAERTYNLPIEVSHLTCWECGQDYEDTGWTSNGKPVCGNCLIHHDGHRFFDPRCSLCQFERRIAQRESLRIEAWHQSRQEREIKDASNSEG